MVSPTFTDPFTTHETWMFTLAGIGGVSLLVGLALVLMNLTTGRAVRVCTGVVLLLLPLAGWVAKTTTERPVSPEAWDFTKDHDACRLFDAGDASAQRVRTDLSFLRINLPDRRSLDGAFDEVRIEREGTRVTHIALRVAYYRRSEVLQRLMRLCSGLRLDRNAVHYATPFSSDKLDVDTGIYPMDTRGLAIRLVAKTPRRDCIWIDLNWPADR